MVSTKTPALDEGEPTVIQRYFPKLPQLLPVSYLFILTDRQESHVRNSVIFLMSFLINIYFIYHNLNDM